MLDNSGDLDSRLSQLVAGQRPPGSARRGIRNERPRFDDDEELTWDDEEDLEFEKGLQQKYSKPRENKNKKDLVKQFTQKNFLAIFAAIFVAVLLVAGHLGRTSAAEVPEDPVPEPSSPSAPTEKPSASQSKVMVHVIGAVNKPGVVEVPAEARVITAIEAAGGVTDSAQLGELNLAMPVSDGSQIYVSAGEGKSEVRTGQTGGATAQGEGSAAQAGGSAAGGKINLNTASQSDLETLPGVGPVTASAIIDWRTKNGKFTSIEQLQEIDGIGPKSFAKLSDKVTV